MATDVQDVLGAPVKRVEDPRFITGKGRYLDDIKLTGMAHLAILRSPYAHANIRSIDTSKAKAMPGVIAVIVGADIPYNPLPMAWPAGGSSGIQNNVNTPRVPRDRHGQVDRRGRRRGRRRDPGAGGRRARRDRRRLRAAAGRRRRREGDPGRAPRSSTRTPRTTSSSTGRSATRTARTRAIADAEVVVRERLVNHRLIPNPMEVRGDIGWYNPGTEEYTIWMSSQTPHIQRLLLTASS